MLPENAIAKRIVELLYQEAKRTLIKDIRIGLGFTAVQLEDNQTGLSSILRQEIKAGCTTLSKAGTLKGKSASYLLEMLLHSESVVSKSLGLATANAILSRNKPKGIDRRDTIESIKLIPEDNVAMIGLFKPLIAKIRSITPKLTIVEKDQSREEVVSPDKRKTVLKDCSVALITATSLLNNTLEDILNALGSTRRVVLLGPSTPMAKEVFLDTPINHLASSLVINPEKVLQIVSEGGGTKIMRPYLDFINLIF